MADSPDTTTAQQELAAGLTIVHANHPEDLRELIAEVVQRYPLGPLEDELFLVQSNGMAQWLKLKLAQDDACGIAAALDMQMPSRFLWSAYRAVLGRDAVPDQSPFDKEPLTWRLLHLLPGCLGDEAFAPLRHFLAGDDDLRKRFQLAERLADLFDQYQVYRADWLTAWEAGQDQLISARGEARPLAPDQRWQAELWRRLQGDMPAHERNSSRARVHQQFLERLAGLRQRPPGLPRRLTVFGISSLPQQMLEALDALSRHLTVQIYVHNPCRFYWADIIEERQLLRFDRYRHPDKPGLQGLDTDQLHLQSNPLLAAWGKQGRDYIGLLYGYDTATRSHASIDLFRDRAQQPRPCLLQQVQQQILDLEPLPPPQQPEQKREVAASDRSISFQLSHSRQREVEVLHDQLLALMDEADGALEPRDIMVMVPDIAAYAPHIEAVFGRLRRDDPRYLPYSIADRSERSSNPTLVALEQLLALPDSRFGVSDVLGLLEVEAFRKAFGLSLEDLPGLHRWIEDSGIRWGLHADQRSQLDLPPELHQNSWKFGLKRMLLGYTAGQASAWRDIEPYDEIGGLDAGIAGKLWQAVATLEHFWGILRQRHTPTDWDNHLRALIDQCLAPDERDLLMLDQFKELLAQWQQHCREAGLEEALPLSLVREALLARFDEGSLSQRFLAGRVNFGTLMPMRAIPFKVVCLLGMNDDDYPRQRPPLDFDLMAGQYRPGDRSRQEDDRYLFLEALLSARERLYISWLGRSVRDNSERTPSVLVGQLRDYLDTGWQLAAGSDARSVSQALTLQHPLQPFSRRYFQEQGSQDPWFTYAHEWARVHQPPASAAPAPPELSPPATMAAVDLEQLRRFMRQPADTFFNRRLNVWFSSASEAVEDSEPFALNGLERYQYRGDIFARCQRATPEEQETILASGLDRLARAGRLPLGPARETFREQLGKEIRDTLGHWNRVRALWPRELDPRELLISDLRGEALPGDGLQLSDWVGPLYGNDQGTVACIQAQPGQAWNGKQGKQSRLKHHYFLGLWLRHLALAAAGQPVTSILVSTDGSHQLPALSPEPARASLKRLLVVWCQAHQRCLPLGLGTAMALLADDPEERQNADRYRGAWLGSDFGPAGDVSDSGALSRCWPDFDQAWEAGLPQLAVEVYGDFFDAIANRETEK